MKKFSGYFFIIPTKKALSIFSALSALILLSYILTISAADINAEDVPLSDSETAENFHGDYIEQQENQETIIDKINLLSKLKSNAVFISQFFGLDNETNINLDTYEKTIYEIEAVRNELTSIGAKPSKELLSSIIFDEPINIDGVLINNFADFDKTFGDIFDLWGISYTVKSPHGTYYICEIIIQDYAGQDRLSSSITQNGMLGYDIYSKNAALIPAATGKIGNILFNKSVNFNIENNPYSCNLYEGAQMLQSLISKNSQFNSNETVSVNGVGQSYRIYCTAASTVHFMFVRHAETDEWKHSLTSNTVYLNEIHSWTMVFSIGKGRTETNTGTIDYSTIVYPYSYNDRLTKAVESYRNKHIYIDTVTSYCIDIKNKDKILNCFTLNIECPKTQSDLIARKSSNKFYIWGFTVSVIITAVTLIVCKVKNKNRKTL